MYSYANSETNLAIYPNATTIVSSLLTPSIPFLEPNSQTISVSLMRHLYATISHLKVNHIVYIVLTVEINFIIQMIQDH